jgi:tetratricopeptide (TPR) repeat protein
MPQVLKDKDPELEAQIHKYKEILKNDPRSLVFARLSEAFRRSGRFEEAISVCQEGLKYHPGYTSGRVTLAHALYEKNDIENAEIEFKKVLESSPENVLALRMMGEIAERNDNADEAISYYERILELNPKDGELSVKLESMRFEQVDAEELLNEAERINPAVMEQASDAKGNIAAMPRKKRSDGGLLGFDQGDEISSEEIMGKKPRRSKLLDVFSKAFGKEAAPSPLQDGKTQRIPSGELRKELQKLEIGGDESEQILNDLDMATGTIADLYSHQGHLERALLIYMRLLDKNPKDVEVKRKIDKVTQKLSKKRVQSIGKIYKFWLRDMVEPVAGDIENPNINSKIEMLEKWLVQIQKNKL